MERPILSVCIPTAGDFARLHLVIQHLRLTHKSALPFCELVIVDNDPDSDQGRETRDFCARANIPPEMQRKLREEWNEKSIFFRDAADLCFGHGVRYVPYRTQRGTAPAKNAALKAARGIGKLCMDSHVLLEAGTLERVVQFIRENQDSKDLFHGPLMWDGLINGPSDMTPTWGSGGLGQWKDDARASDPNGSAFEINAMGMGLFLVMDWLGFNPLMKGFGGEESIIQMRYRKAGRKVWCLPWLRWWHSFNNVHGRQFPALSLHKAWNHIIPLKEMGEEIDTVRRHFLEEVKDPHVTAGVIDAFSRGIDMFENNFVSGTKVWESFNDACASIGQPSDISEHVETLTELSGQVNHITEFGVRGAVSTRALLRGLKGNAAAKMRSYDISGTLEAAGCVSLSNEYAIELEFTVADTRDIEIEQTDLLFIDTKHTAEQLGAELWKHGPKATRFIVLHDTVTFGEKGEDGTPGLLPALRWWLHKNREWFVYAHYENNNGLTILARQEPDKANASGSISQGSMIPYIPPEGPGTELKAILASIGIVPEPNCDCDGKARAMNMFGSAECRVKFWEIVGWLKDGQDRWSWTDKLMAAAKAVANGLAFQINWFDPFPDLVREAIRRAEAKGIR